jgi:hypothetical protein
VAAEVPAGGETLAERTLRVAGAAELARRARRRTGREPLDAPAFLVDDREERRVAARARSAAQARQEPAKRSWRRDVVGEDNDAADLAGAHTREEAPVRLRAVEPDDEALADELRESDRLLGAGRRAGGPDSHRRDEHREQAERQQRSRPVRAPTGPYHAGDDPTPSRVGHVPSAFMT